MLPYKISTSEKQIVSHDLFKKQKAETRGASQF